MKPAQDHHKLLVLLVHREIAVQKVRVAVRVPFEDFLFAALVVS